MLLNVRPMYLISYLWNYTRIIWKGLKLYKTIEDPVDEHKLNNIVETMLPYVQNCGCVFIKFFQWTTPILDLLFNKERKNPYWLKQMEKFYENCDDHVLEHTLNIYKADFGEELQEEYELLDIIGSGSIGQVYKGKHKRTKQLVAIKVLHPGVKYEMKLFKNFIWLLYNVPFIRDIIYSILPLDIPKFVELFEKQVNMNYEASNLSYMSNVYKDNDFIHIPSLIKFSENIVIMEFEEGLSIDDESLNDYNRMKIVTVLSIFSRHNFEISHFNHGDIHKGNWKLQPHKNTYRIVFYDFGFCWALRDTSITELLTEAFTDSTPEDYSKLIKLSCNLLNDHTDELKRLFVDYFHDHFQKADFTDPGPLITGILHISKQRDIIINPIALQCLLAYLQVYKYLDIYNLTNSGNTDKSNFRCFRESTIHVLNVCNTYDIFPEIQESIKTKLNETQIEIKHIFDTVDESIQNTDEIRSLINFSNEPLKEQK